MWRSKVEVQFGTYKKMANWVTPKCLLRTRPHDQHFEYRATHGERLFDIFKRSATTLEEQARAFGCSNRDEKKSDLQVEFKKHTRKMFGSQH